MSSERALFSGQDNPQAKQSFDFDLSRVQFGTAQLEEIKAKRKPEQTLPDGDSAPKPEANPRREQQAEQRAERSPAKDIIDGLIKMPKDKISAGLGMSQDAAKEFATSGDKSAAMAKLEPKFAAAEEQSDKDFGRAMGQNWSKVLSARKDVQMTVNNMMATEMKTKATIETLPQEKQQGVMGMVGLIMDENVPKATRDYLRGALKEYPGVGEGVDQMIKLNQTMGKNMQAMQEAQKPLLQAAMEQTATRLVHAKALELSGETSKAQIMKMQAEEMWNKASANIRGEKIEPKPTLEA